MRLFYSDKRDRSSLYRVTSGVCGNLSAAWFGLVLVTPSISFSYTPESLVKLTVSMLFGITFLVLAFILERRSQ